VGFLDGPADLGPGEVRHDELAGVAVKFDAAAADLEPQRMGRRPGRARPDAAVVGSARAAALPAARPAVAGRTASPAAPRPRPTIAARLTPSAALSSRTAAALTARTAPTLAGTAGAAIAPPVAPTLASRTTPTFAPGSASAPAGPAGGTAVATGRRTTRGRRRPRPTAVVS